MENLPEVNDDLLSLGTGVGSKNENLKLNSAHLRGGIVQALEEPTSHFDESEIQLLKFHGSYQQEDRDRRQELKRSGLEKAYQFMVRSRIPGGVLTSDQYLTHDAVAQKLGNGTMRLTTRQSIQLHGVLKSDLKATIKSINDALLSTLAACGDVNRNVMASPAPPRNRAEERLQAYAHEIAMHLAPRTKAYHEIWLDGEKLESEDLVAEEEPIYGDTYLPRKFKIGVTLEGDNGIDVYTQDIGFVAELDAAQELAGFTVLVGGGLGSTHGKSETRPILAKPLCYVPAQDVIEIAETIVKIQRDHGDRKNRRHARMKYLVEERGIAWFRTELESRLGRAVADPHELVFAGSEDHLGWHEQQNGAWFLGLFVENGRIIDTPRALLRTALLTIATKFKPGIRLTPHQNILLTDIPSAMRGEIESVLRDHGIEIDPHALGLKRRAMACPALPTCGQAVAEAERALPDLVVALEAQLAALGLGGEPISIRMTGCPNGCARPRMGDIGIVGRSLGLYDLFLGGDAALARMNELFMQGVRYEAIVPTLRDVLERWKVERNGAETLGDFAHRVGLDRLRPVPEAVALA